MATREENIKKINDELEKLSDAELDKIAGGIIPQNSFQNNEQQKPFQDNGKEPNGPW